MFPFVDGTLLEVVGFTNKMSLNAGVCVGLRLLLELLVKMSKTQKNSHNGHHSTDSTDFGGPRNTHGQDG